MKAKSGRRFTRATCGTRVSIRKDRMGGIQVWPATLAMEKQVRELGAAGVEILKFGAYIQPGDDCENFLSELSRGARRELNYTWQRLAYINDELAMCLFGIEY